MSRKFRHSAIILFPSGSDDIPLLWSSRREILRGRWTWCKWCIVVDEFSRRIIGRENLLGFEKKIRKDKNFCFSLSTFYQMMTAEFQIFEFFESNNSKASSDCWKPIFHASLRVPISTIHMSFVELKNSLIYLRDVKILLLYFHHFASICRARNNNCRPKILP